MLSCRGTIPPSAQVGETIDTPEGPGSTLSYPEALAVAEPWEHFEYEEEGKGPQQDRHLRGMGSYLRLVDFFITQL